jgi:hypothetical protein
MSMGDKIAFGIGIMGLALAAVNLWLVYRTILSQWLSNSATLVTSFEQQFGSQEIMKSRQKLAKIIQEERQSPHTGHVLAGYWPILSFFDGIGAMARRKAIDKELVFNRFAWRIVRCYYALTVETQLLQNTRNFTNEPRLYEQFEWLAQDMKKRYRSLGKSKEDIKRLTDEYIVQEATLLNEFIQHTKSKTPSKARSGATGVGKLKSKVDQSARR